jgi:DNA-binding PadR family transcriptional regulator
MTLATQRVLEVLLAEPGQERYGSELCELAGLPSGTLFPILARLEDTYGWIIGRWEDVGDDVRLGRPRRRYFRLSPDGLGAAPAALAKAQQTGARTVPARKQGDRLAPPQTGLAW